MLALFLVAATRAADSKIAFVLDSDTDGRSSRIYIANADGSGIRPITSGTARDRAPGFSPNGKTLAYQSTSSLGLDMIVVQALDEGKPVALAVGTHPQWSRDGERLLFSRRQLNEYGLFVIKSDGSQKDEGLKPIAKGQIGRWSPDEKLIAAVVPVIVEGKDRWQIQVVPAAGGDGGFRRALTLPEEWGQVVSLEWSPDGERLLFSTTRQSRYDLYLLNLKAPEPIKVPVGDPVPNPAYGSWSPDGKEILFRVVTDASGASQANSRLCVMNSDGTQVRVLWEPDNKALRVQGTAWHIPPAVVVVKPPVMPPVVKPMPPVQPEMMPKPPPKPPVAKVLGPPKKVHGSKLFTVERPRSPVSVNLTAPGEADFLISVPVLPLNNWAPRRQGVGLTLELDDGSLYRGTVIYSGVPWVTLQGRPRGGKVRLVDGKQLSPKSAGFKKGFKLTLRREGQNLVVAVNDEAMITRPVLSSGIKALSLTLENFDTGDARFNLGGIFYREWVPEVAAQKPEGN
jgi:Tol biopolymer transport system component